MTSANASFSLPGRRSGQSNCCRKVVAFYLFIVVCTSAGPPLSVIDSADVVTPEVPDHRWTTEALHSQPADIGRRQSPQTCNGWLLEAVSASLSEKRKQQLSKSDTPSVTFSPNCADFVSNVTKLTIKLESSTTTVSHAGVASSISSSTSCQEFRSAPFSTITDVTFIGSDAVDYIRSSADADQSMRNCLPKVNQVTIQQGNIGGLTDSTINVIARSQLPLQELHLNDDGITNVASETVDGRSHGGILGRRLRLLDLSRNAITTIENSSFIDLFALRVLNLSYNAIYRLERATFVTSDITAFHLNSTYDELLEQSDVIDSIGNEEQTSDAWPFMDTVDLSHNILSEVDDVVFRGPLSNIRNLVLSYNRISSLPRYIVDQLHKLESIDLSHNDLVWLDVGAFSSASLRHVDLSHNSLRKLVSMTFLYLPSVVDIDLSYNQINQIYKYAFYRLCKVEDQADTNEILRNQNREIHISLRYNRLESDVIFQMMTLYEQQQQQMVDGISGCSLFADLRNNQIQYFLDAGAVIQLNRPVDAGTGGGQSYPRRPQKQQQQQLSGLSAARQLHRTTGSGATVPGTGGAAGSLYVDLEGNDIQCDCRLIACLEALDRHGDAQDQPDGQKEGTVGSHDRAGQQQQQQRWRRQQARPMPSIATSSVSAWRKLNCSGPELFGGFTVDEFAGYALCPTLYTTPSRRQADVGHNSTAPAAANRVPSGLNSGSSNFIGSNLASASLHDGGRTTDDQHQQQGRQMRLSVGNRSLLLPVLEQIRSKLEDEQIDETQDSISQLNTVRDRSSPEPNSTSRHHPSSSFSGSQAAVLAVILCGAVLAVLGGLLYKRNGSSGSGGSSASLRRLSSSRSRSRRCHVFISYSSHDEAWVTGTLLDVIYGRYPRYGVLLQHHVDATCERWHSTSEQADGKRYRNSSCCSRDLQVLDSCMDNCLMTVIVLSDNFFQTVWTDDEFRAQLVSKLESQRHRFLLIYLGNDVIKDSVSSAAPDRKQFFDSSSVYPRLSAVDSHFADRLIDYLPPSGRYRSDSVETEESVALISDDDRCRHERY